MARSLGCRLGILQLACYMLRSALLFAIVHANGGLSLSAKYALLRTSRQGRFNEMQSAKYFWQTATAVDYCHGLNVVRRSFGTADLLASHCVLNDFARSVRFALIRCL
eukprot:6183239-Pleurochrysis_carterae.AAC.1